MPEYNHDPDGNQLRADAIRRDIYSRHGIAEDTPLDAAFERVASKGQYGNAWDGPQQRTQAAAQYVRRGAPEHAAKRWEQRTYLMSPADEAYHNAAGRDATFLYNLHSRSGVVPAITRSADAVRRWDRNHAPLHRSGWASPNTYRNSGERSFLAGLANIVTNTDNPVSKDLHALADWPMTQQLYQDSSGVMDASAQANALLQLDRDSKINNGLNQSPISSYGRSADDLHEVRSRAEVPMSAQRYAERAGGDGAVVPPGFATDAIDFATEAVDKTLPLSLAAASPFGRGLTPAQKSTAAQAARSAVINDQLQDYASTMALNRAFGADEGRTWPEYLFPHVYREGADGPALRSAGEIQHAADLRRRLAQQQQQQKAGLSDHERAAVQQLQREGFPAAINVHR
ncbi:MAG: hypothetical protein EBR88_00335 [Betaproteobacteria bacterium]|nr:hypothetical protein [Betaproteobacteria bacterium]